MKRIWILTTLLILTACAAPITAAPSPTPTATLTPLPTATASPTKTPSLTPTATLPYQPLAGSTYREVARYDMKDRIIQSELSPDGSMLAVLTGDGVYLYDPDTLELRWRTQEGVARPGDITWTADNELLFLYSEMPDQLINPEDGSILEEINEEYEKDISSTSPNGKYFYTYDVRNEYPIYDAATQELLFTLYGSYSGSFPIWMPDGEHIIFRPGEGSFEIWDIERGEIIQELENPYKWDQSWGYDFTPDERYFAYAGLVKIPQDRWDDISLHAIVWDLSTGEPIPVNELDGITSDYGWQLNEHIVTFNHGMVIQIGESAAEMTMLHKSIRYTKTVYRRPDGLLVVLSDAILLYDREFNLTKSTIGHIDAIGGYTNKPISPDGQLLAIETATRFYVWDIGQNELVTVLTDLGIYHVPFTELGSYVRALAVWSPDSERLAISNQINHQVSVWNAASHSIQNTIDVGSFICTMAWVDDSTLALTLREDSTPVYENQCVSQHLVTLNIETEQINYSDQQFPFILNTIGLYDRRHIAFRTWTDYYTEEEVTSMLMIWDSQTDQITCTMEIDESFRVYRLQSAPGIIIAETGQLRVIELVTGKESIVKLNTNASPSPPYKSYLLGDHVLEYDYDNYEIKWYDLDGNLLETVEMDFGEYWAEDPIMTTDGRIFDIVNPLGEYPGVALIELFPPEQ